MASELICDCVTALSDPHVFNCEVGLAKPRPASRALGARLSSELGGDQPITTSAASRSTPYEVCYKHDVVLFRDQPGQAIAAQVLHHIDIGGVPLSLVAPWHLLRTDDDAAVWEMRKEPVLIATSTIVAVCIRCPIENNVARTLVPCYA